MTVSTDTVLAVHDLRVQFFTSHGRLKAVDGVDFEIRKGEVLGLIGESGCGKSMTALSILRLIPFPGRIVGGSIKFRDVDVIEASEDEMEQIRGNRISMIFQDPMTALNPSLTVGKQIAESFVLHQKTAWRRGIEMTVSLLKEVGVPLPEARVREFPHQFSGGMRQRAMIAMALACEPELLIADEPTTALDVTIQAQILDLIREVRGTHGTSIIFITHALGVVAEMCDRVAVMYAGKIVESTDVHTLFRDPLHPYTRGLLASLPRLGTGGEDRLTPLQGQPPVLSAEEDSGCAFAPRCPSAIDKCAQGPELAEIYPGHAVRCWRVNA